METPPEQRARYVLSHHGTAFCHLEAEWMLPTGSRSMCHLLHTLCLLPTPQLDRATCCKKSRLFSSFNHVNKKKTLKSGHIVWQCYVRNNSVYSFATVEQIDAKTGATRHICVSPAVALPRARWAIATGNATETDQLILYLTLSQVSSSIYIGRPKSSITQAHFLVDDLVGKAPWGALKR